MFLATSAHAQFALPIDCPLDTVCTIQKFVDVDPTEGAADHTCGHLTNDGHRGTDFRVPPGHRATALAAASGVVRAIRDGMADRDFEFPLDVPSTRACGNAVVIDHDNGFRTTTCHLRRGSVRVRSGQRVAAGDPIGMAGASGWADFQHIQFTVRRDGTVVDPFTGHAQGTAPCGTAGRPLWTDTAMAALNAAPRATLIAVGFNDGPVTLPMIESEANVAEPTWRAKALVGFAVAAGVRDGDVIRVALSGPDLALTQEDVLPRDRAQQMLFVGRRMRGGVPAGRYEVTATLLREGTVLSRKSRTIEVAPRR